MRSYNQIIADIETLASNHETLGSYSIGWIDENEALDAKDDAWPMLFATIDNTTIDGGSPEGGGYMIYNLQLSILDIPRDDRTDRTEIASDTHQILGDFFAAFKHPQIIADHTYEVTGTGTFEAVEWGEINAIGWRVDLGIKVAHTYDAGNAPFTGSPFSSVGCPAVTIKNGAVTLTTVPAGGEYDVSSVVDSLQVVTLYKRPTMPTQTTSYYTGDTGWQISQGLFDGWDSTTATGVKSRVQELDLTTDGTGATLLYNNPYGNKNRFTDLSGTQTDYATDNAFIDNYTGLRWFRDWEEGNVSWAGAIDYCEAITDGDGNTDYHLPPRFVFMSLAMFELENTAYDYLFQHVTDNVTGFVATANKKMWLADTLKLSTTNGFYMGSIRDPRILYTSKTSTSNNRGSHGYAVITQPTTANP